MVRLCAIYCIIAQKPGVKISEIAQQINISHSTIDRLLPAYKCPYPLLWENEQNGLHIMV